MTDREVERLWEQYASTKLPEHKEQLIIHYTTLVKYIAGRLSIYLGQNVEYDDLISYGIFGLIDAIDKFDLTKNIKFETYASLRVRGAIIDNIRKMDWVPRSLRKKQKDIDQAYRDLEYKLGRVATDEEVMDYLGLTPQQFSDWLAQTNVMNLVSLEEHIETKSEGIELSGPQTEQPEAYVENKEAKALLSEAIEQLPEREKKVIFLYYFEELTLKEISAIMSVSESRISQLHTKGVSRLRLKLGRYNNLIKL